MDTERMHPERDYQWGFSLGHEESIRGTAAGEYEAAPVASDILEHMVALGEIERDAIRTIYESEHFPPAALGFAHNLTAPLRETIRTTLLDHAWQNTPLADEFGPTGATRFVPLSFQEDPADIRRIDAEFAQARASGT